MVKIEYEKLAGRFYAGLYLIDNRKNIFYWNRAAEKISGFSRIDVLGSSCMDNIILHTDQEGQSLIHGIYPLVETMRDGQTRNAQVYLRHKRGHHIPVWVHTVQLRAVKGNVIGGAELLLEPDAKEAIKDNLQELKKISLIDELTQLANQRYVNMELERRFAEKARHDISFGLLLIDIDDFEKINHIYDRLTGNRVFRTLTRTIHYTARPYDLYGRWAGRQIMGIIRNINRTELKSVGERVRLLVQNSVTLTDNNYPISVTVSIGAVLAKNADDSASLVQRAGLMLQNSKDKGGNISSVD
ncbi:MAG: diguanylate cyclase [Desulfobacteraceae bacterium]|nr:diguanylate cyclase [Desulfobacteraceae bacterium]